AGRAGDEDQAARPLREIAEHRRQMELRQRADFFRNHAVHRADGAALAEDVAAEAGEAADAEREIELVALFEALLLRISEDAVDKLLGVGRLQVGHLEPAK